MDKSFCPRFVASDRLCGSHGVKWIMKLNKSQWPLRFRIIDQKNQFNHRYDFNRKWLNPWKNLIHSWLIFIYVRNRSLLLHFWCKLVNQYDNNMLCVNVAVMLSSSRERAALVKMCQFSKNFGRKITNRSDAFGIFCIHCIEWNWYDSVFTFEAQWKQYFSTPFFFCLSLLSLFVRILLNVCDL